MGFYFGNCYPANYILKRLMAAYGQLIETANG